MKKHKSMPMKYPLLFPKKITGIFSHAEPGAEPAARAARSQVLRARTAAMIRGTTETWHIPSQLASAATSSALPHCHLPWMPLPTLTLFTKRKKKKKLLFFLTLQNGRGLGWMPGKRVEKTAFIYLNRTRQNSLLLEINIKPCRNCPPTPRNPPLPHLAPSPPLPFNIVSSTKDHITNASCGSFGRWPPSRR